MTRRPAPGFTLVEILAALAVFGFVLLGLGEGVQFGLQAWDAQARLVGQRAELDAVDRLLRGLVARMDPGSLADAPRVAGAADRLAFTTDLPEAAGALQRHVDVALFVDPTHHLQMRWAAHLHQRGGTAAPGAATLLEGVQGVRFAYLRPAGSGGSGWAAAWSEGYLPRLVRIQLAFPPGDRRHWPDIVAEPAQDRPRE